MSEENNKKDIEVVEGIGNLDISPVYEHLSGAKPKMQNEKPKNIVIPQVRKNIINTKSKDEQNENDESSIELEDLDDIDDAFEDQVSEDDELDDDSDDDSDLLDDINE